MINERRVLLIIRQLHDKMLLSDEGGIMMKIK